MTLANVTEITKNQMSFIHSNNIGNTFVTHTNNLFLETTKMHHHNHQYFGSILLVNETTKKKNPIGYLD